MKFPNALQSGDTIAVTAPSSGVFPGALPRLDIALEHLRSRGFRVIEGDCLRDQSKSVSAPREARAAELEGFLRDSEVAAIIPPWGGELAVELLELIDFEALKGCRPTWILGYSDTSTLLVPLTLLTGWATAHGPNLMDMVPTQTDPLTLNALSVLSHDFSTPISQSSSTSFQTEWGDFSAQPDVPLDLSEPTRWRRLDGSEEPLAFQGRLIGGCLDTVALLAGSVYGDVPAFVRGAGPDGAILYLENVEQSPGAIVRILTSLRRHGWFAGLSGLLLGRSAAKEETNPAHITYLEAVQSVLAEAPFPVLYDVDIGHQPPQMTLVNGALAAVRFENGGAEIVQTASAKPEPPVALHVSLAHAGGSEVTMTVQNATDSELRFCRYHTPFEGVRNDIFRISRMGVELAYGGKLAKRMPPGPDDYLTVRPGEYLEATVDLKPSWPVKRGTWTVQYRGTSTSGLGDSQAIELRVF